MWVLPAVDRRNEAIAVGGVGRQASSARIAPESRVGAPSARLLIYALILVSSSLQVGIAPLLPGYAHRFDLSGLADGALLAATGLATFAVALPAGRLADRLGARRLTLAAAWIMVAGTLGQAGAWSFAALLGARLLFGIGYGIIWTAGLAWLGDAAQGNAALGGAVACSGAGGVLGPAFAGFLAGALGVAAPYLVAAGVLATATVALTAVPVGSGWSPRPASSISSQLRVAVRHRSMLAASASVVVGGIAASVSTLLVPLELHAAGVSESEIGLIFSFAGGIFILGSAATTMVGRRAVSVATAFLAMVVLVVALSAATVSTTTIAVVSMLCAMTASRSVLWTVAYPLGAVQAEDTGVGLGVVTGLLNVVWAATAVVTPLLAGVIDGRVGARATFAAAQLVSLAVVAAGWICIRSVRSAGLSTLERGSIPAQEREIAEAVV